MDDDIDEQYEDLQKAKRRAKKQFKEMNFRKQELKCCQSCGESSQMQEEELCCFLANQEGWNVNDVPDELGVCDNWKPKDTGTGDARSKATR